MDQNRAPYYEALREYIEQRNLTFHVPGHQHGLCAPPEFQQLIRKWGLACDITEVHGIDDIHTPGDQCWEAQRLAADLYRAEQTYFLVNGSTVGNQAMFLSAVGPGSTVLLPHNSHRSVFSALLLSGAQARFFSTDFHPELLCSLPPTTRQVVQALDETPQADAVFLTSPTYHGACAPLEEIVREVHSREKLVLVDEAWGGHLRFCDGPSSALEAGADLVVQSAHKMTPAPTQSALLHLNTRAIRPEKVQVVLSHLQTSSPSSLLVAGLDCARRHMALNGEELWRRACSLAVDWQKRLNSLKGVSCFATPEGWDQSRLVVEARGRGWSGYELEKELRRHGIQVEMAEPHQVLLLVTPGHDERHGDRLVEAFSALPWRERPLDWESIRSSFLDLWNRNRLFQQPEISIREAFFSPQTQVSIDLAVDRTSAELLYCYPPGVPFVYPGQRFSAEALELIKTAGRLGGSIKGGTDPQLNSVMILDNE